VLQMLELSWPKIVACTVMWKRVEVQWRGVMHVTGSKQGQQPRVSSTVVP
jgi:hypothetical protein